MSLAYSFGGKNDRFKRKINFTPGPAQYAYDKQQRKKPPSFSIGKEERRSESPKKVPGPGEYDPKEIKSTKIEYSMRPKPQIETIKNIPGPGEYSPERAQTAVLAYQKPPIYSFGAKSIGKKQFVPWTPGPGQYNHSSSVQNIQSKQKFGKDQRKPLDQNEKTPGPGRYEPRPRTQSGTPQYRFGTGQRDKVSLYNMTPGPGNYDLRTTLVDHKKRTMSAKSYNKDNRNIPGVGNYELPIEPGKNPLTAKTIGDGKRTTPYNETLKNPGPGLYDQKYDKNFKGMFKENAPKVGTYPRQPLHDKNVVPGPGNYEYKSKIVEGVHTMDPKQKAKMQVPSAAQYREVPFEKTMKREPTLKFGTEKRPDNFTKKE